MWSTKQLPQLSFPSTAGKTTADNIKWGKNCLSLYPILLPHSDFYHDIIFHLQLLWLVMSIFISNGQNHICGKEELMLIWSILASLTGLLWSHLPYTNHHGTFELLRATSQQNDCTSSNFAIILWPWVKVKVIQTGIILKSLVVSSIISSLKKKWFTSALMLANFKGMLKKKQKTKNTKIEFSFLNTNLAHTKKACIWSKSIQKFSREWALKFLISHTTVTLNEGQDIKTSIKM